MKKLIILFISCLILTSCCNDKDKVTNINKIPNGEIVTEKIYDNGHVFLEFSRKFDYQSFSLGIVHDPVCEQNDMKNLIDSINNSHHINLKVNF